MRKRRQGDHSQDCLGKAFLAGEEQAQRHPGKTVLTESHEGNVERPVCLEQSSERPNKQYIMPR